MTSTVESAPSPGHPRPPHRLRSGPGKGWGRRRRGLNGVFLAGLTPALRIAGLFAVPFGLASWLLAPFLGVTPAVLCAVSVLTYPAAFVAHELAHAALYRWLAPEGAPEPQGQSTLWTAQVERAALPMARDVLVTLAGPLAGLAVALLPQLAAWGTGASPEIHVALLPSTTFALQHLGAVLPGTADFAALTTAVRKPGFREPIQHGSDHRDRTHPARRKEETVPTDNQQFSPSRTPFGDGLTVTNLTSGYRRGADIVKAVSMRAPAGRITALVGPNGSGKSTLLHTVLGLIHPREGEVLLDGAPLAGQTSSRVGFCADDLPVPELLTGLEYVETMALLRAVAVDRSEILEYFAALRMAEAAGDLVGSYSHGMKRKVQLVANVLHQPSLLILDEPFRGLDPETAALLRRVLKDIAGSGRAILVSTHDLSAVESFCQDIVVLSEGRVVLDSDVQTLRTAAQGRDSFLEDAFLDVTGLRDNVEESAQRAATLIGGRP